MHKKEMERPKFPKRAVITGGMPYSDKDLHIGHVGGVFIHADMYARFLRDRIGKENVIFVSGTDCYGSPITEYYRKQIESKNFEGTIEELVELNHNIQKDTLNKYDISLNLFGASGLGRYREIHREICAYFFNELYKIGAIKKITAQQFYDEEKQTILNGRQVVGTCPIVGCASEKAYADECGLGHQYMPKDLINPISVLTGKKPTMIDVTNWYFDLPKYNSLMQEYVKNHPNMRSLVSSSIMEFLKEPVVYIKFEFAEAIKELASKLPVFETLEEKHRASFVLVFKNLEDRDRACEILSENSIRFRTGKTLVPFRLTGSTPWGVPVPEKEGLDNLTFWVWPESLFAPISFTQAYLEQQKIGGEDEWKKWWCSKDAQVYQFIGSDNIYFYGIPEIAMFMAMQGANPTSEPKEGDFTLPNIIANNHVLFLDKKMSSSSEIKPPTARQILDYYTPEQIKSHFLAFGLATKNVGFKPKPLNPEADPKEVDPALKEGNLLTNVFNRLVRSFFYSVQKYNDGKLPYGIVSDSVLQEAEKAILKYERHAYKFEFHLIMDVLDSYIRIANKAFVGQMNSGVDPIKVLVDTAHTIRTATILLHPIAPNGTEMIKEYLNVSDNFFSWDTIFEPIYAFISDVENHEIKFLEPKVDFFKRHESQFE